MERVGTSVEQKWNNLWHLQQQKAEATQVEINS
jgi:hypothetical protein